MRPRALAFVALMAASACQLLTGLERADKETPTVEAGSLDTGIDASVPTCDIGYENHFDDAGLYFGFANELIVPAVEAGAVLDFSTTSDSDRPPALRVDGTDSKEVRLAYVAPTTTRLREAQLELRLRLEERVVRDGAAPRIYLLVALAPHVSGAVDQSSKALALASVEVDGGGRRLLLTRINNLENPEIRRAIESGALAGDNVDPAAGVLTPIKIRIAPCRIDGGTEDVIGAYLDTPVFSSGDCVRVDDIFEPDASAALVVGVRSTDEGRTVSVWYDDIVLRSCRPRR